MDPYSVGTVKVLPVGGVVHVRSKISFLAGVGVGYVLGAKAGQQRYEQIKTKSQELWQSDPVQTKVSEATDAVKAAAPVVTGKVTEAAKHAGEAAKSKISSDDPSSPDAKKAGTSYTAGSSGGSTRPSSTTTTPRSSTGT
jgi:hypothetical protein